jgi:hypothetical protein
MCILTITCLSMASIVDGHVLYQPFMNHKKKKQHNLSKFQEIIHKNVKYCFSVL